MPALSRRHGLNRLLALPLLGMLPAWPTRGAGGAVDRSLPWVTAEARVPRVVYRIFDSRTVGARVSYHAYVPETGRATEVRLPVLYWLHGSEGGISGIAPLTALFDETIRAGRVPAMIVVFVNGLPRRLWADAKDGSSPVETVFIGEVIPDVDRTFRTIASREGRILEGFSMGGYGAARIGFKHPDLFAGVSILAGGPLDPEFQGSRAQRSPRVREQILRDVCSNDLEYFRAISPWTLAAKGAAALRANRTVVRQATGLADDTRDLSRRFHDRMNEVGIAHGYFEVPNVGHDARALLTHLLDRDGAFYRRALGQPR
jgi:enterochelin esterase-like enzyme